MALVLRLVSAEPVKVASPGLRTQPADPVAGSVYTEHLSNQLAQHGLRVITERDIQALLGMERQKQLLGGGEAATECFAELGSALGAEGILIGDVVKAGANVQLNLKIIRATNGEALAIFSEKAGADDVLDVLTRAARQMAGQVRLVLRPNEQRAGSAISPLKWVALGVGAVGLGVGVGGLVLANGNAARFKPGSPSLMAGEEVGIAADGPPAETVGWAALGVGAAACATAALLFFVPSSGSASVQIMVLPSPRGATVGLGGIFW